MIAYKIGEGLSTFYAKDKRDLPKPNYPVPAIPSECDIYPNSVAVFEWHGNKLTGDTVKCVYYYP